jgi:CheY-like chemotaxis protein
MPVVLGIMRGHRGAILVDSQAGCGSRVELLLPAAAGELPRAAPASGSSSPVEGKPVGSAGLTVLVVDDETMVREVSRAMLERLGHSVLEACDGLEALEVFGRRQDEVACVLLDLTMPRMDGLAALVELRRLKPEIGIILTSGYSEQEAVRRVTGPVPDAFLQKPFRFEELVNALGRLGRRE